MNGIVPPSKASKDEDKTCKTNVVYVFDPYANFGEQYKE